MLFVKSLTREILKNKVFLILLFLMTMLTSFMFFFIRFSIDSNLANLNVLSSLTENQQNYKNALISNSFLSMVMLLSLSGFTALLFVMFWFRLYSGTKKQFGIYKALGYKNIHIQLYFVLFAVTFSILGLLLGMLIGYFASSVHLSANAQSYNVSGLVKGVSAPSALIGIFVPALLFAIVVFCCGFVLYGKENGKLLFNKTRNIKHSRLLTFADRCVSKLPIKNKAPLRIALRKPISILFLVVSATVLMVMLVLGWSLTQSSQTVYKTQTDGHYYQYEAIYNNLQIKNTNDDAIYYLSQNGLVLWGNKQIEQTLFGMDFNDKVYSLKNLKGNVLSSPENGTCYVSAGLSEMYRIKQGSKIIIKCGDINATLTVKEVAYNAKSKTLILDRQYLAQILGKNSNNYNGVLSLENTYTTADKVIDNIEREDMLNRDKVSSNVSAVINQSIGLVAGIILTYLALFIAFQDSTKDMLIMDSLGYKSKEIKKLLINIFLPLLLISVVIMAFPAVLIAKTIQTSLALQMGDYMPFSTNIIVLIVGAIILVGIYLLAQLSFALAIKHTTKKKNILQYTAEL